MLRGQVERIRVDNRDVERFGVNPRVKAVDEPQAKRFPRLLGQSFSSGFEPAAHSSTTDQVLPRLHCPLRRQDQLTERNRCLLAHGLLLSKMC